MLKPKQRAAATHESAAEGEPAGKTPFFSAAPSISMPKGGGAVHGIGEKFAANPVTGTGAMTVPIATSPSRSGFGPSLALSYDSSAGNTAFGFGWNLSLPQITRKTDKGLPHYLDAAESDVFILSGAEDLVPVFKKEIGGDWARDADGNPVIDEAPRDGYMVRRYRPRIEGLFARIERWTRNSDGDMHWRSISRDNVTTLYGASGESRVADPGNKDRIFSWLICESYDDKGNAIVYRYQAEDSQGIDLSQTHESNRTAQGRAAQRYLKRILYGNRLPNRDANWKPLSAASLDPATWMFEVVFDFDDGHYDVLPPDAAERHLVRAASETKGVWPVRPDPFSSYRAGFDVRLYRRCRRVLMFHRFNELGSEPCLVRSTAFDYADIEGLPAIAVDAELAHHGSTRFASFIQAVTQSGYRRTDQAVLERDGIRIVTYLKKSFPPVEFAYTKAVIDETVRDIDTDSLKNLPAGLDGSVYQWIDLDGEGLSGILAEQAGAWFYKRNLSAASSVIDAGVERTVPRFGPVELVAARPVANLSEGARLLDLEGDGQLDLVAFGGQTPGFYARNDRDWDNFRPFSSLPNLFWNDPNLRFIDLNGDGHADVLITESDVFTWHPSLAEKGFGPACRVGLPFDDEAGPRLVFADGTESIYLADMSGDGLTDLARVRNGEVCYWPNLGYGRFGAKVTMDNAPVFDREDQFDQRRIRLADIDGSGTNDVIYLGGDGVRLYFNQSGNRLSDARRLTQFPAIDNLASVLAADLLGNGTACLVWSSPLPGQVRGPMRYVDLMGGQKPHLLARMENNLGAEIRVRYAPSTRFYLADKLAGRPWITRLPFPVHVVERVDTYDRLSRNLFVTRHAYHHGFFDGVEREFRGFGMVEQWDTEAFAAFDANQAFPSAANVDASHHAPPVLTRTWFHTGVYFGGHHVSDFFAGLLDDRDAGEYYREPGLSDAQARQRLLDDTVLPAGLSADEEREACRALKGTMLHQEIYALDESDRAPHPYTVTEQNFTLRCLQPQGGNRHAVFLPHAREVIDYHYERNPADPRIAHALTIEVDPFGNVRTSAAIGYGRRQPDMTLEARDRDRQGELLITYAESDFTNPVDDADDYRAPLPCDARTHALTGLTLPAGHDRFTLAAIQDAGAAAGPLAYEKEPNPTLQQKRLIERLRTRYRRNDMTGPLPPGELQSMALIAERYKLAFTPGLLSKVYGARVSDAMLGDGGYVQGDGGGDWWMPSGQVFYSPDTDDPPSQELAYARAHFFLPHRFRDPFHTSAVPTETVVRYDVHHLLVQESRDALGNRVTAGERDINPALPLVRQGQDYRVLQPSRIMDPNRNRSAVAFDALGMVAGSVLMGKPEDMPRRGDLLDDFVADLTDAVIAAHLDDPLADPAAVLQRATNRSIVDLHAYYRTKADAAPRPAVTYTLTRETHDSDLAGGGQTRFQHSFSYSDGFGREIQKKAQAEPGPVPRRDAAGRIITVDGQPAMTDNDVAPRWIGSGWTVFNNKGKPVRQYEPFFTDRHRFEFDARIGVSQVLLYDPIGRVVAILHPDHTWEKVAFNPWRRERWDVNDTVLAADPAADADVGGFFARLPAAAYLPGWHAQRAGGALGAQEQEAARRAAIHAQTPSVIHEDALARTFLTVAHNKFRYSDAPPANPPGETFHPTRIRLDIEGNQREVIDAKDRSVMRYDYDMLGNRIHQAGMEAGERWLLNDATGNALYEWDSLDRRIRTAYDPLRRPAGSLLREGAQAELLVGRHVYGEGQPNPETNNLRGKLVQLFDQAGLVTTDEYDFKGNLLHSRRRLAQTYDATLDWSAAVGLEAEDYVSRTRYDALNRPTELVTPDNSIVRPGYNEANLLERLDANLRGVQQNGQPVWTAFVTDIDYDAKGQRTLVGYGNGVATTYAYDPLTFRLTRLLTRRKAADFPDDCPQPPPAGWPGCQVQNLHYTYDPAGNITHLRDDAQQAVYFRNKRVDPSAGYLYDALYQLIEATGREHLGQAGAAPSPGSYNDMPRAGLLFSANDGGAVGRYLERYAYDLAGNFTEMQHRGSDPANPGWRRSYAYDEPSLLDAGKVSNRLSSTTLGAGVTDTYSAGGNGYDAHGNMLRMPHLQAMQWDFRDQLQMTRRQAVNAADDDGVQHQGERTWYVYDSAGQRVRKVTELANGQRKDERIYLAGFEIYRRHGAQPLVRETLHVMDHTQRIALVETRTQGNDASPQQLIRYQFGNHLGSVNLELDGEAKVISYEEYFPFGGTAFLLMLAAIRAAGKRYRYTGKERDEESGLYYHGARYFAPWLGRWTRTDPDELADGLNAYCHVRNNPIVNFDPQGTDSRSKTLKLEKPAADIGKFTKKELADATTTVFGELTAKLHTDSEKEAKAIASTIFNRLKRIEVAREKHEAAKEVLSKAKDEMKAAATAKEELGKRPTKYKKELGEKGYEEKLAAASKAYKKATDKVAAAGTAAVAASSERIAAESRVKKEKRANPTITLTDLVEQNKEYEGTKKGKQDFADFPSMSDPEQERNLKRWEIAKKAVETLAADPSKTDKYEMFVSEKIKSRAPATGTTKIGGNIFWK